MASTTASEPFDHVPSGSSFYVFNCPGFYSKFISNGRADLLMRTLGLKYKKNRKKKLGGKHKSNGDFGKQIGHRIDGEIEIDQVQTNDLELKTLSEPEDPADYADDQVKGPLTSKYISTADEAVVSCTNSTQHKTNLIEFSTANTDECETIDIAKPEGRVITSLIPRYDSPDSLTIDTKRRFDELARERTALRDEVALLRRSLEGIQGNHKEDLSNLCDQLLESKGETEHYETQYRNLLGKVGTLRSQLGERLKTYAV